MGYPTCSWGSQLSNKAKVLLTGAFLLLLTFFGLSGVWLSRTESSSELATCVAQTWSREKLQALGAGTVPSPSYCFRFEEGIPLLATSEAGEAAQEGAVFAALASNDAYRGGRYALSLPEALRKPPHLSALAEVGLLFEEAAKTRLRSLACSQSTPARVAALSEMDPLFSAALVGIHVQLTDLKEVQRVAGETTEAARESAVRIVESEGPAACEKSWEAQLAAQELEWKAFADGKHPWVPSCSVQSDDTELYLQCLPVAAAQ